MSKCENCGESCSEDDLCPCESFCPDCHQQHLTPACEEVDKYIEEVEREILHGQPRPDPKGIFSAS